MNYKNYHRDKTYQENESHFKNIFETRVEIAERFIGSTKSKRVLDIGASTGVMLDIFKSKGYETWGVEPSKSAKIAKKKGHKIINDYFEKAKIRKNYFDIVIMNHTLEHVENPDKFLQKINTILKENGLLIVDVPNAGGLASRVLKDKWPYRLPQEHVSQFTKKNLTKLFEDKGFNVIHFESRSGIFEFHNPLKEIKDAFTGRKKRFFTDLVNIPYDMLVTFFDVGDSMTIVGRKG